jgi:hypothetical protein
MKKSIEEENKRLKRELKSLKAIIKKVLSISDCWLPKGRVSYKYEHVAVYKMYHELKAVCGEDKKDQP